MIKVIIHVYYCPVLFSTYSNKCIHIHNASWTNRYGLLGTKQQTEYRTHWQGEGEVLVQSTMKN